MMREHMPWMVEIQASSTFSASAAMPSSTSAARMRCLSSAAALSVKVMASTWSMLSKNGSGRLGSRQSSRGLEPGRRACMMRCVSVNVLPDPAPADTKSGPSRVRTIRSCLGSSWMRAISASSRTW